ncbi:hypothetical protein LEMLEM_LOCUS11988, partial [Lemmus lemmus]
SDPASGLRACGHWKSTVLQGCAQGIPGAEVPQLNRTSPRPPSLNGRGIPWMLSLAYCLNPIGPEQGDGVCPPVPSNDSSGVFPVELQAIQNE